MTRAYQPNTAALNLTRREILRIGGLSVVGLNLPALLAHESRRAAPSRKPKSCLLFFLEGGPSHIDLWDMKPAAPAEVRGEFKPIPTTIPGLQVCEHLPKLPGKCIISRWCAR